MTCVKILLALAIGVLATLQASAPEIGSGDVVRIVVAGQQNLTGDFEVDPEGTISYPILGKVKVAGFATTALEKKLVTLLSEGYLKKPDVSVTVKEFRSRRVFVTGELGKPGPYPLKGDRTLLTLMSDIGSLQGDIGHEVIIVRPPQSDSGDVPSETQAIGSLPNEVPGALVIRLNLKELLSGNPAKNVELEPGDTVYFPKAANVYVMGNVSRPGAIRFQEGMTVFQALTLAGGVTEKGSQKVKVIRMVNGKQTEIKAKPSDLLQPEDTIRVPERFF